MKLLKKKELTINNKCLVFCDLETLVIDNIHVPTCYSIYSSTHRISLVNSVSSDVDILKKSEGLMDQFLSSCESITKDLGKTIFYIHNLSRFDGLFILKAASSIKDAKITIVSRDKLYYKINITINKNNIEFRDSYLVAPLKLNDLSNLFLGEGKIEFIHHHDINLYKNIDYIETLKVYCLKDTELLDKSFIRYRNEMIKLLKNDPVNSLTLSSYSLRLFLTNYYDADLTPIHHMDGNRNSFIRTSYIGGSTELYKPSLDNGYHYDINSLYPYVMSTNPMPIGKGEWVKSNSEIDINSCFGFLEITVSSPPYMYRPFLTVRDDKLGLIAPLGTWRSIYFSEEIKEALKYGYKIDKIHKFIKFEKGFPFKGFVNDIYKLRLENIKTPMNKMLKLILNSLYGRMGMDNESSEVVVIDEENEYELKKINTLYNVKNILNINKKVFIFRSNKPNLIQANEQLFNGNITIEEYNKLRKEFDYNSIHMNTAVQIASAVTSYGRIEIYKYKQNNKYNTFYSDTDSIFCQNKVDDQHVHSGIGGLKLEGVVKKARFAGLKMYYCEYEKDEDISIKSKGVSNNLISPQQIDDMISGKEVVISTENNFIRDHDHMNILTKKSAISLNSVVNKRVKTFNDKEWIDTYPLQYTNIPSNNSVSYNKIINKIKDFLKI